MGQRVTCITNPGTEIHHITHIGVTGGRKYTVAEAVTLIRKDATAFYTLSDVLGPFLRVAVRGGTPYVRTTPDSETTDNLLALPECS
jgi:hypothetical protein